MKVLVSLFEEDPERLELQYFRTLSLRKGGSPPVLTTGLNAIYVGPLWTREVAEDFASLRYPMPMPKVVDWDEAFIERLLARVEDMREPQVVTAADLDHEKRGW